MRFRYILFTILAVLSSPISAISSDEAFEKLLSCTAIEENTEPSNCLGFVAVQHCDAAQDCWKLELNTWLRLTQIEQKDLDTSRCLKEKFETFHECASEIAMKHYVRKFTDFPRLYLKPNEKQQHKVLKVAGPAAAKIVSRGEVLESTMTDWAAKFIIDFDNRIYLCNVSLDGSYCYYDEYAY